MDHTRTLDFVRYNSGKFLCDSGDIYGRAYDQPAPPADQPLVYANPAHPMWGPAISTAVWLEYFITEHAALTAAWQASPEYADPDLPWFDALDAFMVTAGYREIAADNVCNGDHDFDQAFVWQVWVPADAPETIDWMWADDAVVVYFIHTGCDLRSGYSPPIIAESCRDSRQGEYVLPIEHSVVCHLDQTADGASYDDDAFETARHRYYDASFWDVCDWHGDAVAAEQRGRETYITLGDGTVVVAELNEEY